MAGNDIVKDSNTTGTKHDGLLLPLYRAAPQFRGSIRHPHPYPSVGGNDFRNKDGRSVTVIFDVVGNYAREMTSMAMRIMNETKVN